jgi:hypothetical protein
MTVAIAVKSTGGAVLYADRNQIGTDGAKSQVCKIHWRDFASGSIALVNATSDAEAAQTFATEILDSVGKKKPKQINDVLTLIRKHLRDWSEAYKHEKEDLNVHDLMACSHGGSAGLYVLRPPNTILPVVHKHSIGTGAHIVDPMLDALLGENWQVSNKQALLYLSYMVKHAKDQEAFVGGGSNAVFIPDSGKIKSVDMLELKMAEEMAGFTDELVNEILRFVMFRSNPEGIEKLAESYGRQLTMLANSLRDNVPFKSLDAAGTGKTQK